MVTNQKLSKDIQQYLQSLDINQLIQLSKDVQSNDYESIDKFKETTSSTIITIFKNNGYWDGDAVLFRALYNVLQSEVLIEVTNILINIYKDK